MLLLDALDEIKEGVGGEAVVVIVVAAPDDEGEDCEFFRCTEPVAVVDDDEGNLGGAGMPNGNADDEDDGIVLNASNKDGYNGGGTITLDCLLLLFESDKELGLDAVVVAVAVNCTGGGSGALGTLGVGCLLSLGLGLLLMMTDC